GTSGWASTARQTPPWQERLGFVRRHRDAGRAKPVAAPRRNPSRRRRCSSAGDYEAGDGQRCARRTALYSFLSNPRHNTGHPVIWIEWLLSTLFDASLLTPEPPFGGSFFAPARGGTTRAWCPGRRPARSLHSARFEGDFLTL